MRMVEWGQVRAHGRAVASSDLGRRWCRMLADRDLYGGRLQPGRRLVRAGAVGSLVVAPGCLRAVVSESEMAFEVTVEVGRPDEDVVGALRDWIACRPEAMVDLVRGNVPEAVADKLLAPHRGILPDGTRLRSWCPCLDDADICCHVAAALYALGPILDEQPEALLIWRHLSLDELLGASASDDGARQSSADALAGSDLSAIFGVNVGAGGDVEIT